ncbi:MAG: hypothetical protein OEZ58_14600 [Gammaproteobacteria bacterium]|nr:hypothetical protein [Gammaproteobacteria bacterium]
MIKQVLSSCLIGFYSVTALCANNNDAKQTENLSAPLMQYDHVSLSEQTIRSASGGLVLQRDWGNLIGIYTHHDFSEPMFYDFPDVYHSIDSLLDTHFGRHQYLVIFKSESSRVLSGSLSGIQAGAVYGYEWINKPHLSLVLGGGIAVGEFGVERSDGSNMPAIPVPLIRFNYQSTILETKFEFLTGPNWSFTLRPKSKIRLTFDSRLDQLRDARDLIFESNLVYRFFDAKHEMGDFAGIAIGFKNDNVGAFALANKHYTETLEAHYQSLFATLDLTLIKVSVGRAFAGRVLYREQLKQHLGEGYFITVQGVIPLGR